MRRIAASRAAVLGLRGRIVLFAAALALIPLIVFGVSIIRVTADELKSSVNDRLMATTRTLMEQIRFAQEPTWRTLVLSRDAIDDPALDLDAKVALLRGGIESLPGLVAMQLAVEGSPPIYLFKQNFKAELETAGESPTRAIPARGPSQAPGGAVDSVRILDPLRIDALDTWLLPLQVRLREPVGGQNASLAAYLDLGDLPLSLRESGLASPGGIWILSERGSALFGAGPPPSVPGLDDLYRDPQLSSRGVLLVTPFAASDGTAMLGAVAAMEAPAWTLLVAAPERQAYALIERMRDNLLFWLSLCLAASVGGALVLAQRISRPIRAMADVSVQVGLGHFHVQVPDFGRRDEIGVLGSRLNQMIRGLADSRRQLENIAHQDLLTGLPNRRSILKHLDAVLGETRQGGRRIALLFLDLDRFKNVNDSLGHAAGDDLLRMTAQRLLDCLGGAGLAARLGGDEFLVVLHDAGDRRAISAVAARIIDALRKPFHLMDIELYIGGTIGISVAPEDGLEVADLIGKSDMAMYKAKQQARGHYHFFDSELKARAVRRLTLDGRLRRALEREELEVYYQPQIESGTGRIVAVEALLRWPDREGGFVASPAEFIPLAEETGLIVPLGDWVMAAVCGQTRAWHQAGLPRVLAAVNVSALQFRRQDFFDRVCRSLEEARLDACHMGLELTEGVLLEDVEHSVRVMGMLKDLGVQLMIDDFGTGYSSLAYLRRFPLDYVKVAQEFVSGIDTNPNDTMIVGAVLALSKSLGLKTIAEGVETRDQLAYLMERDCDIIQGYFCGRPSTAIAVESLLARQPAQDAFSSTPAGIG